MRKECVRCEHCWFTRTEDEPLVCPKCKSPYWDRQRGSKTDKHVKYCKLDPQNFSESRPYSVRVFETIWGFYKRERRGNKFNAKNEFSLYVNSDDHKTLVNFLFSFDNYTNSKEYEKGIIMKLPKFISEWKNFSIENKSVDIDDAVTNFEGSFKTIN